MWYYVYDLAGSPNCVCVSLFLSKVRLSDEMGSTGIWYHQPTKAQPTRKQLRLEPCLVRLTRRANMALFRRIQKHKTL